MRPTVAALLAIFAGGALAACETLPPRFAPDATEAQLTADGLLPLERSGFAIAWARPGASFLGYERIWTGYTGIAYRTPPRWDPSDRTGGGFIGNNYALPKGLGANLADAVREIFDRELTARGDWRAASAEAPDVLGVRVSLVDLVVDVPLDTVSDQPFAASLGELTIVVELHDTTTGRVLGRFAERSAIATPTSRPISATPGSAIYESRRIFTDWARKLRTVLGELKAADLRVSPALRHAAASPHQE